MSLKLSVAGKVDGKSDKEYLGRQQGMGLQTTRCTPALLPPYLDLGIW